MNSLNQQDFEKDKELQQIVRQYSESIDTFQERVKNYLNEKSQDTSKIIDICLKLQDNYEQLNEQLNQVQSERIYKLEQKKTLIPYRKENQSLQFNIINDNHINTYQNQNQQN